MRLIKTLAFAFILVTIYTNAKAQTKEETEKWIVEKINKLMSEKKNLMMYPSVHPLTVITWVYKPTKFSIQDGKISIEYDEFLTDKSVGEDEIKSNIHYTTVTAKINLLDQMQLFTRPENDNNNKYSGYNYLIIFLKCSCATELKNESGNSQKSSTTNNVPFFIAADAEPDILNRLNKAFTQLKTFYPAQKEVY